MRSFTTRGWTALPSTPGRAVPALAAAALATLAVVAGPGAARETARPAVKQTQALVVLLAAQPARSRPSGSAPVRARLAAVRPITNARTTVPLLGRKAGRGGAWLHVSLPGRPHGRSGWIRERKTKTIYTSWRIVVDTSERRVTVYQLGYKVRAFRAIVGTTQTPTPHGSFFVEETVMLRSGDTGGPYALALSARSDVLQEFAGGPGQIALHGLENVGGTLGTAVSHGCVRLANDAVHWLVIRVGPGTPVTIRA